MKWLTELFSYKLTAEEEECKCERCGYVDEEANICGTCERTICDGCMADFISGECLDCSNEDYLDEDE